MNNCELEKQYQVHGPRFTELLRAANAATEGKDVDYFRALAEPQVIAVIMGQLIRESSYSRHYEQKFHAVAAQCADLAGNGIGTIADIVSPAQFAADEQIMQMQREHAAMKARLNDRLEDDE